MCDYRDFWNELTNLPQENIVEELVKLFAKYNLLNEDGTPKETLHFELKRWKNDYFHDRGCKDLSKHITAIANTIVKNPFENAILVIGIDERRPLHELPYENDSRIDRLNVFSIDIEAKFINKLKNTLRENTIPHFHVEELEHWTVELQRKSKLYPIVFLKIPVKVGHFYGVKESAEKIVYCWEMGLREAKPDESPEFRMRSLLHILKDIHKGIFFDIFTGFGYIREPQLELDPQKFKVLYEHIPLDLVELESLVGLETARLKKSYMDYLTENKLLQRGIGGKWTLSYTAIILFGSRKAEMLNFHLPEIELTVNIEESEGSSYETQRILLIPLRKSFAEVFGILDKLGIASIYYFWDEIKPAFYEVLLNSVLHMNYFSKTPKIKITLYKDRIRVENPCLWDLRGINIEKLNSIGFPKPNEFLYNFLKKLNFLKKFFVKDSIVPHGLSNLLKYMLIHGFPLPSFYFEPNVFAVELHVKKNPLVEEFYELELNKILTRKKIDLHGQRISSIDFLDLPALTALHIQLFEQPENPQDKFNEFFDGDIKFYDDFIENIRKELQKISGGE